MAFPTCKKPLAAEAAVVVEAANWASDVGNWSFFLSGKCQPQRSEQPIDDIHTTFTSVMIVLLDWTRGACRPLKEDFLIEKPANCE